MLKKSLLLVCFLFFFSCITGKDITDLKNEIQMKSINYSFLKNVKELYLVKSDINEYYLDGTSVPDFKKKWNFSHEEFIKSLYSDQFRNFNKVFCREFSKKLEKKGIKVNLIEFEDKGKIPNASIVLYLTLHGTCRSISGLTGLGGGPIAGSEFTCSLTPVDLKNPPKNPDDFRLVLDVAPMAVSLTPAMDAANMASKGFYKILMNFIE